MFKNFALPILISLAILFCLNIFMVSSLTPDLLGKQLISWFIGLALFFAGRLISPKNTASFKWFLFIFTCLFLLTPIVSNHITRGSRRWIDIAGFTFQPAEFSKPLLLLFLVNTLQPFWLIIPALIVMIQPDLGSALSILFLSFPTILHHQKLLKTALIALISLIIVSPLIWKFALHDYQRQRLIYFLEPQKDPLNQGYNLIQSIIAIGSGGLTGQGFKQGSQGQLQFLPEKQTDFIFASLSEELGLTGICILLLSYYLLIKTLVSKAYSQSDHPLFIFTITIAALIWFQVFVNIGMNLGLLPVTGIPLPFISVGGSSLMALLFSLGIIFSS